MHRTLLIPILLTSLLFASCASTVEAPDTMATGLSHDVYFSLKDASPEAADRLVQSCHQLLASEPGILFFAAGTREATLDREVNDVAFDVALHIVFADRAAHDAYQDAPNHLRFIEENKDSWSGVRVFDSDVTVGR